MKKQLFYVLMLGLFICTFKTYTLQQKTWGDSYVPWWRKFTGVGITPEEQIWNDIVLPLPESELPRQPAAYVIHGKRWCYTTPIHYVSAAQTYNDGSELKISDINSQGHYFVYRHLERQCREIQFIRSDKCFHHPSIEQIESEEEKIVITYLDAFGEELCTRRLPKAVQSGFEKGLLYYRRQPPPEDDWHLFVLRDRSKNQIDALRIHNDRNSRVEDAITRVYSPRKASSIIKDPKTNYRIFLDSAENPILIWDIERCYLKQWKALFDRKDIIDMSAYSPHEIPEELNPYRHEIVSYRIANATRKSWKTTKDVGMAIGMVAYLGLHKCGLIKDKRLD